MQSQEPLDASLVAYAAGLVDSDGAIGIRRRRSAGARTGHGAVYWSRIRIKQVDREGLDLLVGLFGGRIHVVKAAKESRKPSYLWELTHERAAAACLVLLPYLQIKADQAALAVECVKVIAAGKRRRVHVPHAVIPGEPLVPLAQAASRANRSLATGYMAVRAGRIPFTRIDRRIYVPESFISEWAERPHRARRPEETTDALEALYEACAARNRGDSSPGLPGLSTHWRNALASPDATREALLGYIAGVVDADGYIGIARNTYRARVIGDAKQAVYQPRLEVKQVTPEAVDIAARTLGGSRFISKGQRSTSAPLTVWSLHSAAAVRACEALQPHLRIKLRQAQCVLMVGDIHAEPGRRKFPIPDVVDGEPLVSLSEAAARAGRRYDTAHQSVRLGNIPYVRRGRRIYVPESFIATWASRGRGATRRSELTERLEALFQQCKSLNKVGAAPTYIFTTPSESTAGPTPAAMPE